MPTTPVDHFIAIVFWLLALGAFMSFAICAMVSRSWYDAGNMNLARRYGNLSGLSLAAAGFFSLVAVLFSV